jgi:hypothetical protein
MTDDAWLSAPAISPPRMHVLSLASLPGMPIKHILELLGFPTLPIRRRIDYPAPGPGLRIVSVTIQVDRYSASPPGHWVLVPLGPVTIRVKFES